VKAYLGKDRRMHERRKVRERQDRRSNCSMVEHARPQRDCGLWISPYQCRFATEGTAPCGGHMQSIGNEWEARNSGEKPLHAGLNQLHCLLPH